MGRADEPVSRPGVAVSHRASALSIGLFERLFDKDLLLLGLGSFGGTSGQENGDRLGRQCTSRAFGA
jgi:hypothetical protein